MLMPPGGCRREADQDVAISLPTALPSSTSRKRRPCSVPFSSLASADLGSPPCAPRMRRILKLALCTRALTLLPGFILEGR